MKKVKIAFAALAVFTAVTTMSFTSKSAKVQDEDCWSTEQRYNNNQTPDLNQAIDCPGDLGSCCVKPAGEPGQFVLYGFTSL